jgi:hypothetical protein
MLRKHAVTMDGAVFDVPTVLFDWLAGRRRSDVIEPFTFVVDIDGRLRLAPRRSEHVALAGGQPVLAAGEMTFAPAGSGWRVRENDYTCALCGSALPATWNFTTK